VRRQDRHPDRLQASRRRRLPVATQTCVGTIIGRLDFPPVPHALTPPAIVTMPYQFRKNRAGD
jgi:hypothetical protein